jgi:GTP cyclohydrolase IA
MASLPTELLPSALVGPEAAVRALLEFIGEDVQRDGLTGTPGRVVRSLIERTAGYGQDPGELLRVVFEAGAPAYEGMVVLRGVPFASTCEHHLMPFTGTATLAYLPNPGDPLVGLSKLARLVDVYALRLQSQERMTAQIAEALMSYLQPLGAACVIRADHTCLTIRGAKKATGGMVTSELRGRFLEDPRTREEFIALTRERE